MVKPCRKCAIKIKITQISHCIQEILLKIRYFERGLLKSLKKVNLFFFFRTQSFLMDKVIKNERGLELVTSCSSSYKTGSEKFLY